MPELYPIQTREFFACRSLRTLFIFVPEKWKICCLIPLVTSLSLAISFLGQFRGIPISLAYFPVTVKQKKNKNYVLNLPNLPYIN
jgi:hypothetical protein